MKIACLVGKFPSLSETFILNQITGLIERGHEVDIYGTKPNKPSKIHPDVEKYQLLEHTYYHPYIPANKLWRALKGLGLLLTHFFKSPGVLLRSLNVSRYGNHATSLRLLYNVIPLLQTLTQYDIIYCHFGNIGLTGALLREIGGIKGKLITKFYGFDLTGIVQQFGNSYYEPLFAKGDLFLPLSNLQKHLLVELGCDEKRIIVHRLGIDCKKFTFTPRYPQANTSIRLITIARLVEKKGVEYGIRAIGKLSKHYPNIEYNIIGDGDLREELETLIEEMDVGDSVKLLGWKQQEEVIELLNNADVLLAPSVTSKNGDQEGTPVVLMEAMAMGLPVLSTQHSGIPELVEDEISGFLVPERDSDALAQKISYLIEHPETWVQMGQKGRLQIENHYNIDKLNDELVEIFQQVEPITPARSLNKSSALLKT